MRGSVSYSDFKETCKKSSVQEDPVYVPFGLRRALKSVLVIENLGEIFWL